MHTRYPWDEPITVTVTEAGDGPWTLALRVPAWCARPASPSTARLIRAGAEDGYLRLHPDLAAPATGSLLTLAMPPRLIAAHPRVDAVRGAVAVARGPLVYCLEHADCRRPGRRAFRGPRAGPGGGRARRTRGERADPGQPDQATGLVRAGGPGPLYRDATARDAEPTAAGVPLTAIPYFLWNNRGAGPRRPPGGGLHPLRNPWRWLHEPERQPDGSAHPAQAPVVASPLRSRPVWRFALAGLVLTVPQFAALTFAAV